MNPEATRWPPKPLADGMLPVPCGYQHDSEACRCGRRHAYAWQCTVTGSPREFERGPCTHPDGTPRLATFDDEEPVEAGHDGA